MCIRDRVTGVQFVKHWMHVGLVGLDGTKMSKLSLIHI